MASMDKHKAIELLGGTVSAAAKAVGISYQAVDKWPDKLPPRIADRVQAARWRIEQAKKQAASAHPEAA